jgi:hypothetical protein
MERVTVSIMEWVSKPSTIQMKCPSQHTSHPRGRLELIELKLKRVRVARTYLTTAIKTPSPRSQYLGVPTVRTKAQ